MNCDLRPMDNPITLRGLHRASEAQRAGAGSDQRPCTLYKCTLANNAMRLASLCRQYCHSAIASVEENSNSLRRNYK